jgi:hypothetical protein
MFHLPNPYYVTASPLSSNTNALREAGIVEDSLGDFESNYEKIEGRSGQASCEYI